MQSLVSFFRRFGLLAEFFSYLWKIKRLWLFPVIAFLVLFSIFVVAASSSSVAPFIYTLF